MLGKEAALFVTSGTQGNLLAVMAHCVRGDEVILGDHSHIFYDEVGGAAALGGIHPYPLPVQADGTLALADIRTAICDYTDIHFPLTKLVCLENTQGMRGAVALPVEYIREVHALCAEHELNLHIDGARIWNAATALDIDIKELVTPADSIMFCLSKGLCAPIGSMLVGDRAFIERARRLRKMLGGGMRQVGILAAAGIIALEKMTRRLADDHATARLLGKGLSQLDGITLDSTVHTNMVFFSLDDTVALDARGFSERMLVKYNINLIPGGSRSFRAVTHYWITPEHVETVLGAVQDVLKEVSA